MRRQSVWAITSRDVAWTDERIGLEAVAVVAAHCALEVGVVARQHALVIGEVDSVLGGLQEHLLVDLGEKGLRAVAARLPQRVIKSRKQGACRQVPAVPEIVRQFLQPRKLRRYAGRDFESEWAAGLFHGRTRRKAGMVKGAI